MHSDIELIDLIKDQFGYKTDLELAGFLGVSKDTISAIRNKRTVVGESLRFTILQKWKAYDRVLFRKAEDFVLRSIDRHAKPQPNRNESPNSVFSTGSLVAKILDLRRNQKDHWALPEVTDGAHVVEDSTLLDLYKSYRNLSTDEDVAQVLGIKRNSISMVRHGRSRLGPLPRLRIYRDVYGEDTTQMESALESSESLLSLMRKTSRH